MKYPNLIENSLPASGKIRTSSITLNKARTVSVTLQCTYNASASREAQINAYYSPDGTNWDTEPFSSQLLLLSAGNEVQETLKIDPPEHGYMVFEVENIDSSQTLTAIKLWYSVERWRDKAVVILKHGSEHLNKKKDMELENAGE